MIAAYMKKDSLSIDSRYEVIVNYMRNNYRYEIIFLFYYRFICQYSIVYITVMSVAEIEEDIHSRLLKGFSDRMYLDFTFCVEFL